MSALFSWACDNLRDSDELLNTRREHCRNVQFYESNVRPATCQSLLLSAQRSLATKSLTNALINAYRKFRTSSWNPLLFWFDNLTTCWHTIDSLRLHRSIVRSEQLTLSLSLSLSSLVAEVSIYISYSTFRRVCVLSIRRLFVLVTTSRACAYRSYFLSFSLSIDWKK